MTNFPASKLLVLISVICFVLAAFGVVAGRVDLLCIGLAFYASASLVS